MEEVGMDFHLVDAAGRYGIATFPCRVLAGAIRYLSDWANRGHFFILDIVDLQPELIFEFVAGFSGNHDA